MPLWQELTHIGLLKAIEKTNVAVLPTGALEAHGNHLPLGTDNILPKYLVDAINDRTSALVLPPINYGDSWIFNEFEGTITVEPSALVAFYTNVMKGVFKHSIRYLLVLNGHGGNSGHLETAAKDATNKGERIVIIVNWWRDLSESARAIVLETPEGHAAEDETSEVMHVAPYLVDMENATKARVRTKFRVVSGTYRRELIPRATFGDPTRASKEKGKLIMEQACDEIVELVNQLEKGNIPYLPSEEN
ncbi:MAG: creatininase family protein [Candidatus Thorarchaeota archaeon]|nr:creatininase family protein [Candidatus Thorarchaeota archaeon]